MISRKIIENFERLEMVGHSQNREGSRKPSFARRERSAWRARGNGFVKSFRKGHEIFVTFPTFGGIGEKRLL
jgi:hypothetical protein